SEALLLHLACRDAVRENISVGAHPLQMAETPQTVEALNTSAGHLSVHVDGEHPVEVPFLFDQEPKRLTASFAASAALDLALFALLAGVRRLRVKPYTGAAILPENRSSQIVWLAEPGPGGGGGGGGNKMKEPPRQAELPGKDKITVPVQKAPKLEQQVVKNDP